MKKGREITKNVNVRDAQSRRGFREGRDGEEGLAGKVGQRRKQDATSTDRKMLISRIIKDGLVVFDD